MRHIQLISLFRYIVHCRYVPILEGVDASIANYMDCISDERATELNEKLNEKLIALKREAGIKIGIEV